jgi:hypothetical protein
VGKWTALKGTLKPLPIVYEEGADYQATVDATKAELAGKSLQELADLYNDLRDQKEEAEAALKEINAQVDGIEELLATQMEDLGMSNFKLASGGQFILTDQPHTTVKDKNAVREWFEKQGLKEILAPPWSTLNAMVKGILEDPIDPATGEPRPMPEGIDIFLKTSVQRRKK